MNIKQSISAKQINELTPEGRERLFKWYRVAFEDRVIFLERDGFWTGPFLTIGQMFDLIYSRFKLARELWSFECNSDGIKFITPVKTYTVPFGIDADKRFCYLLWEVCKDILESRMKK